MQPLNWSEIYVVSDQRRLPSADEVAALRDACGKFPDGYEDFLATFGFGDLDGAYYILLPEQIASTTSHLRDHVLSGWLDLCEEFGDPLLIPLAAVDDGIPLAVDGSGGHYFCSPSDPGVLWFIGHGYHNPPATLPLDFRNPFVHQVPGQEAEAIWPYDLVFDPHRDAVTQSHDVGGPRVSSDVSETLETLVAAVHSHLQPTKVVKPLDFVTTAYIRAWGAQVSIGYGHQDSKYWLSTKFDAQHAAACDALLASVMQDGYVLTVGPEFEARRQPGPES